MDQGPSGYPDGYDEPRPRPTGVTVIAIITLIFGVMGFCGGPIGIVSMFGQDNAFLWEEHWLVVATIGSTVLGWLFGIADVAMGWGLLKLKPWARGGTVLFSVFKAIYSLGYAAFNIMVVMPRMYAHMPVQPGLPPNFMKNFGTIISATTVGCVCVMTMYYLYVAYYLTRPAVKEAFEPR